MCLSDELKAGEFTFHYVSTYTNAGSTFQSYDSIYIPLCFYLYRFRS